MDLGEFHKHKESIKTGDLIAVHSLNLPSLIICLLTKSRSSHVATAAVLSQCPDDLFLIQASHDTGVVLVEAERYFQNLKGVAAWVPLKHDWAKQMNPSYQMDLIRAGLRATGLGFDMQSLWRGMLEKLLGPLAPLLTWMFPKLYESLYCSALAAWLKREARLLSTIEFTPGQIVALKQHLDPVPLYPNWRSSGRGRWGG